MPEIKLYNENCIDAMDKLNEKSISLIVTDPPYNLGNFMKNRDTNLSKMRDNFFGSAGWDDMEFDEWEQSMNTFFKSASRKVRIRKICFTKFFAFYIRCKINRF